MLLTFEPIAFLFCLGNYSKQVFVIHITAKKKKKVLQACGLPLGICLDISSHCSYHPYAVLSVILRHHRNFIKRIWWNTIFRKKAFICPFFTWLFDCRCSSESHMSRFISCSRNVVQSKSTDRNNLDPEMKVRISEINRDTSKLFLVSVFKKPIGLY